MDSTSITSTISSGKNAVLRMESLLKSCSKPEVKAGKMALLKCGSTASKVASAKKSGEIMAMCSTRLTAGYARSVASPGAQSASERRRARAAEDAANNTNKAACLSQASSIKSLDFYSTIWHMCSSQGPAPATIQLL